MTPGRANLHGFVKNSVFSAPASPLAAAEPNGKPFNAAQMFRDMRTKSGDDAAPRDAAEDYADQHRALGLPSFDEHEWDKIANGYDDTCGMATRQEFARELLMAVFEVFLEAECSVFIPGLSDCRPTDDQLGVVLKLGDGFDNAAHQYLSSLGIVRLHLCQQRFTPLGMMLWRHEVNEAMKPQALTAPQPQSARYPNVPILPQALQDNTAALEAIALKDSKTDIKVALNNAVMAEMGKVEAGTNRCLKVAECYLQARGLEVYLCHRTNAAGIVVGASLTEGDPVRPVFRLSDLERFLSGIKDDKTPDKIAAKNQPVSADKIADTLPLLALAGAANIYAVEQCKKLVALYEGRYDWQSDIVTARAKGKVAA